MFQCRCSNSEFKSSTLIRFSHQTVDDTAGERVTTTYNGEEFYTSKRYDIDPIIDRVGGGDSFSGGIIHGLMTKPNQGAALEFAVAASALKQG